MVFGSFIAFSEDEFPNNEAEEERKFQEYHQKRNAEREALKEQRKQWAEEEADEQ